MVGYCPFGDCLLYTSPEAPKQEQFSKPKEYEQAVQTFEQKSEEYARKVEELNLSLIHI